MSCVDPGITRAPRGCRTKQSHMHQPLRCCAHWIDQGDDGSASNSATARMARIVQPILSPGNTRELLAWAGTLSPTGGNAVPLANTARPPLKSAASCARGHSSLNTTYHMLHITYQHITYASVPCLRRALRRVRRVGQRQHDGPGIAAASPLLRRLCMQGVSSGRNCSRHWTGQGADRMCSSFKQVSQDGGASVKQLRNTVWDYLKIRNSQGTAPSRASAARTC